MWLFSRITCNSMVKNNVIYDRYKTRNFQNKCHRGRTTSWSWLYGSWVYNYPIICQWLAAGLWFSPVSSTNKTDHHHIAEISLKLALSTITIVIAPISTVYQESSCFTNVNFGIIKPCWITRTIHDSYRIWPYKTGVSLVWPVILTFLSVVFGGIFDYGSYSSLSGKEVYR